MPADTQVSAVVVGILRVLLGNSIVQIKDVAPVVGYLSQMDARAHFGLGSAPQADVVEIRWPNGQTQQLRGVAADQTLTVIQDAK